MATDAAANTPDPARSYLTPYEQAVRVHGASFEATLWASKDKQVGRFDVIAQMLDFSDRVIVDAGCGLADFAAHLQERGVRYEAYVGIEGVEQMARAAGARKLPRCEILHADFAGDKGYFKQLAADHPYDVVVFSGSLNTFDAKSARAIVRRAWKHARVGVAFNFLSRRHDRPPGEDTGPARRFNPAPMVAWALRRTPNVLFRQDYFQGHDATIVMVRPMSGDPPGSAA